MARTKDSNQSGGIKGFFNRAASSFQQGFQFSREWSYWLAQRGGTVGLFLASTSMVVLMPLIFEINREITVCPLFVVIDKRYFFHWDVLDTELVHSYVLDYSYFIFVRNTLNTPQCPENQQP